MDGRPTWTDCDEAGDYVVPNVLSPRDLVSRPDNMDKTVSHIFPHCNPNGYFLDAQGQVTLLSVVQPDKNLNTSKIVCISSLSASLKMIRSIATEKKWSHCFF